MRTYKEILDRLMENPKLRGMYNKNRKKEEVWNALPKEQREFALDIIRVILEDFSECEGRYFQGLDDEVNLYLHDLKHDPVRIPNKLFRCIENKEKKVRK